MGNARFARSSDGLWTAVLCGGLLLGLPAAVLAQAPRVSQRVSLEGEGGIALASDELGKLTDPGPAVGARLDIWVSPRIALRLGGVVDLLDGAELAAARRAPDMRVWHYTAGVEGNLLPEEARWSLFTGIGFGATRFDSDRFTLPQTPEEFEFDDTYFTAEAGLKLGYLLSDRFSAFVGSRAYLTRTQKDDTVFLTALDPAEVKPFGTAWTFPVTAGFSVRI